MTWLFLGAICVAIWAAMRAVHRSQASWLNDADHHDA